MLHPAPRFHGVFQAGMIFGLFILFLMGMSIPSHAEVNLYGYFSVNYEDVGETPDGSNDPGEFAYPHFNLMMQSKLSDQVRTFISLAGDDASTVNVRNIWGEYFVRDYLKFRVGKVYRPFGLFNEKLDAVPTYLGIEPPELFDGDHLMLPRTGTLMVHGFLPVGNNSINYALMTGNKEVLDEGKPISWDLRYNLGSSWIFGTSGYYSEEKGSPIGVGEGPPPGGILPWMASDTYTVLGGYIQTRWDQFTIKAAYWTANHDAVRDPEQVALLSNAGLNTTQLERFGLDNYDPTNPTDLSMIKTDGSYTVSTYYIRLGYTLPEGTIPGFSWEVTPFVFWDSYSNPETIASKTFGGDNEAGLAEDGVFQKPTTGIVLKPSSNVAFKIDASSHMYKWVDPTDPGAGSKSVSYQEIRFDVSYLFR